MKTAVRYQSRSGNTKSAADVIAKAAGVSAEPISVPVSEPTDTLFIGGGVYGFKLDPSLIEYIDKLNPKFVKKAVVFSTAGGMNKTADITAALKNKGLNVADESLAIKMGVRSHVWIGGKGTVLLSKKQMAKITAFADKILKS